MTFRSQYCFLVYWNWLIFWLPNKLHNSNRQIYLRQRNVTIYAIPRVKGDQPDFIDLTGWFIIHIIYIIMTIMISWARVCVCVCYSYFFRDSYFFCVEILFRTCKTGFNRQHPLILLTKVFTSLKSSLLFSISYLSRRKLMRNPNWKFLKETFENYLIRELQNDALQVDTANRHDLFSRRKVHI